MRLLQEAIEEREGKEMAMKEAHTKGCLKGSQNALRILEYHCEIHPKPGRVVRAEHRLERTLEHALGIENAQCVLCGVVREKRTMTVVPPPRRATLAKWGCTVKKPRICGSCTKAWLK